MNATLPNWDTLKFAYTKTDCVFSCEGSIDADPIWGEGHYLPFENVQISPAATVLSYGLSVFEGLKAERTEDGRILVFRVDRNAWRFGHSANQLAMPPFPEQRFIEAALEIVLRNERFVPPAGKGTLYLRPILFADEPQLGLRTARRYRVLIYACPVGGYFSAGDKGLRLRVLEQGRVAPGGTGSAKAAGNYAGSLNRRQSWHAQGYDDVLFLDAHEVRFVTETTGSNVFARLKDGTIVTPPLDDQILPGITRESVIRIAREVLGFKVEERPLSIDEVISDAAEVFCTGTAWTVRSVGEIQRREASHAFEKPKAAPVLLEALRGIQSGKRPDPFGWTRAVSG
ncbi:MAG: branched chain amino acid aminotransferase [Elusimicrobia bacterium CG_4_10_14_0_2_um_filter_63_34]|nr:MAG: branched chain amino acid aminotransferase [Elusimicrobia bacterium CG_4_10_14_0_2_um_filter_63_34]